MNKKKKSKTKIQILTFGCDASAMNAFGKSTWQTRALSEWWRTKTSQTWPWLHQSNFLFLYFFISSMITSTNCEPGQFLLSANPHDTTVCQMCAEGKSTGGLPGSETCRFILVVKKNTTGATGDWPEFLFEKLGFNQPLKTFKPPSKQIMSHGTVTTNQEQPVQKQPVQKQLLPVPLDGLEQPTANP